MIALTGIALSGAGFRKAEGRLVPESFAELPLGVPIWQRHDWLDESWDQPVGVAVPRREDGAVVIDAVLASTNAARLAAKAVVGGLDNRLSIVALGDDTALRPGGGVMRARQVLLSVDLVDSGADPAARITAVRLELTEAEREVQRRLDEWLAVDVMSPPELLTRAAAEGTTGISSVFRRIVKPLVTPELLTAHMQETVAAAREWSRSRGGA